MKNNSVTTINITEKENSQLSIFSKEDIDCSKNIADVKEIKCPHCGNEDVNFIIKRGKSSDGYQKYLCKKCKRSFKEYYTRKPRSYINKLTSEEVTCPKCGSKTILDYGTTNGLLQFKCHDCNCIFLDPRAYQIFDTDHMVCRNCGNDDPNMFCLDGHSYNYASGIKQRFLCKKCGACMTEGSRSRIKFTKSCDDKNIDKVFKQNDRINDIVDLINKATNCKDKQEIEVYIRYLKKHKKFIKSIIKRLEKQL